MWTKIIGIIEGDQGVAVSVSTSRYRLHALSQASSRAHSTADTLHSTEVLTSKEVILKLLVDAVI